MTFYYPFHSTVSLSARKHPGGHSNTLVRQSRGQLITLCPIERPLIGHFIAGGHYRALSCVLLQENFM